MDAKDVVNNYLAKLKKDDKPADKTQNVALDNQIVEQVDEKIKSKLEKEETNSTDNSVSELKNMLEEKKSTVEVSTPSVNATEPVAEVKVETNVTAAETESKSVGNGFMEKPAETMQSKSAEKQVEEMLKFTNLTEI